MSHLTTSYTIKCFWLVISQCHYIKDKSGLVVSPQQKINKDVIWKSVKRRSKPSKSEHFCGFLLIDTPLNKPICCACYTIWWSIRKKPHREPNFYLDLHTYTDDMKFKDLWIYKKQYLTKWRFSLHQMNIGKWVFLLRA